MLIVARDVCDFMWWFTNKWPDLLYFRIDWLQCWISSQRQAKMNANQRMAYVPVFAWTFMIAIKKAAQPKDSVHLDLVLVVFVSVRFFSPFLERKYNMIMKNWLRFAFIWTVVATCDQEIKNNITYFISPSFPALMSTNIKTCKLKIKMMSSDISQLRFDFIHFSIVNIYCNERNGKPTILNKSCTHTSLLL